jgi:hypothetical protein
MVGSLFCTADWAQPLCIISANRNDIYFISHMGMRGGAALVGHFGRRTLDRSVALLPQVGQHVDIHGVELHSPSFTPIPTSSHAIIRQLILDEGLRVSMTGVSRDLTQV